MKDMSPPDAWQAVALSRALGKRPLPVLLEGRPVVLFRDREGQARALQDRCPHRHAPLSGGRVVDGALECPYHGWRFSGTGHLSHVPCHIGEAPAIAVPPYCVKEQDGLLFVARKAGPAPYVTCQGEPGSIAMRLENRVRSTVLDVAENILDATHTHFTHKGLLRGLSSKRYKITVEMTAGPGWVEAVYEGEPRQDGLISKLLEGQRGKGVARFLAPGIAELEFWGKRRLNLSTTFHLRQETAETVHGIAILSGPRQKGLGLLKAALLRPFFRIALKQDQHILEACSRNASLFGEPKPVIGPLDILRGAIADIMDGRTPEFAGTVRRHVMEL